MGRVVSVALAGWLVAACATGTSPQKAEQIAETSVSPTVVAVATPEPTAMPTPTPAPTATPAPDWTKLPVAANDAQALAAQFAMVEAAIRDPKVTGDQLKYVGHLQQLIIGRLADYPDWRPAVFAALPEDHRAAVQGTMDAGKQLRLMSSVIPKSLPDWRIVDAAPIEQLLGYYKEAEAEFGVGWYYLAAIHLVETRMGRIRGLSSAGAQGPMQFMPGTWAIYGKGDVNSNRDAIMAAARYLKAAGAPRNMPKALYAYNHSQLYVNALMSYAEVMKTDANAYRGYHGWQVYYPTKDGPFLMKVGWVKE